MMHSCYVSKFQIPFRLQTRCDDFFPVPESADLYSVLSFVRVFRPAISYSGEFDFFWCRGAPVPQYELSPLEYLNFT